MIALSISLPDNLAKASQQAAKNLGISRTQFIRLSIAHELQRVEKQAALKEMVKGFNAMGEDPQYLQESEELDSDFDAWLPEEKDEWWKK